MSEPTPPERRRTGGFVERHRERLFALTLLLSGLVFSLGLTLLVLAISVKARPPGTRFETQTGRLIVGALGVVFVFAGHRLAKRAFGLAGW